MVFLGGHVRILKSGRKLHKTNSSPIPLYKQKPGKQKLKHSTPRWPQLGKNSSAKLPSFPTEFHQHYLLWILEIFSSIAKFPTICKWVHQLLNKHTLLTMVQGCTMPPSLPLYFYMRHLVCHHHLSFFIDNGKPKGSNKKQQFGDNGLFN